ncbi:hypothetical protein [Clostridium sp.]|uniref:hypothetical protein n=1 Tax=Clostridium sp. TaxID=1506 RepID=UPI00399464FB
MFIMVIGIIILILFIIFRNLIRKTMKVLFYIGIIVVILLLLSYKYSFDNGFILNSINTGVSTIKDSTINNNIVYESKKVTDNGIGFIEEKVKSDILNFIDNIEGAKSNKKLTFNEYINSSIYSKEIFQKGDKYVYINGILCELTDDNSSGYNIYTMNLDGENYKPVNYNNNDFSGFPIGTNSITIDGITYYKNLDYNKISVYGEEYGTKKDDLQYIKNNKIIYKTGDEYICIDNSKYKLVDNKGNLSIDGKNYDLIKGNQIELKDYLNINGTIYWKSSNKNFTSININGENYISSNNSIFNDIF